MRVSERNNESPAGPMPTALIQSSYTLDKFTRYPDLKPKYLEKEANLLEVNAWIRQVGHYIRAGYKHSPPKKSVYIHLSPLLHQIWISALDCKTPEDKSLEELTELIKDEAKLRQPKHQRGMTLIQTKRGSEKHSDFLKKISENYSVAEYDEMSGK